MSVSQITHTTGNKSFHVGAISAVLTVSGFFCMLNETVLNMALKSIMGQFGTSAITAQWLSTGYMLIMGVSIPVSAFHPDHQDKAAIYHFHADFHFRYIGMRLRACFSGSFIWPTDSGNWHRNADSQYC